MKRFPDTHQALNQESVRQMRAFLVKQLKVREKDEAWVKGIWTYFDTYPLYDDIKDRLDVLWHHVFNPAVQARQFKTAALFIDSLSMFINKYDGASVMRENLEKYQDALAVEQKMSAMHQQRS